MGQLVMQLATYANVACYKRPMPTPFDDELKEFLDYERRERERKTERDARLEVSLSRLADQQNLTAGKLDVFAVEMREQMKGVHSRLSALEDDAESTGNHNLETYKSQIRELKEDKGQVLKWIIGAGGSIAMLLLAGAGTVIWFLLVRGH